MTAGQILVVVLIGVGSVAYYAGHCWWFPFARCRWCRGRPQKRSKGGRTFGRVCKHCGGSGQRPRTGFKVWSALLGWNRKL
jgi:hypothetical protein